MSVDDCFECFEPGHSIDRSRLQRKRYVTRDQINKEWEQAINSPEIRELLEYNGETNIYKG